MPEEQQINDNIVPIHIRIAYKSATILSLYTHKNTASVQLMIVSCKHEPKRIRSPTIWQKLYVGISSIPPQNHNCILESGFSKYSVRRCEADHFLSVIG